MFFTVETVATAWERLKHSGIENGFFGILQILKNIENIPGNTIQPYQSYKFDRGKVSDGLNEVFTFEEVNMSMAGKLNVIFPPDWEDAVFENFLGNSQQSLLYTAILNLHNVDFTNHFDHTPVAREITDLFLKLFRISDKAISVWFDNQTENLELKFQKNKPGKKEKLSAISPGATSVTITVSGSSLTKKAGDLTSAAFFQTLYANLDKGPRCLLLSEVNILERYGLGKNKVTDKVPNKLIDKDHNRIIYGAPGTGKSKLLKDEAASYFPSAQTSRVTFHPDYTYGQFVGTYKPVPLYREAEKNIFKSDKSTPEGKMEPVIDYQLVPGPFLIALKNALLHPYQPYLLIIEEINRANAAAVFGDVFQLLDRDETGTSEYPINFNADMSGWLRKELGSAEVDTHLFSTETESGKASVRLPANMYLWATMNSADQGVMPLDTAFKRRWAFKYIGLNENQAGAENYRVVFGGKKFRWNAVRKAVNDTLSAFVPEDRQMGPFMLKKEELANPEGVKNKFLFYLKEDVSRHRVITGLFNPTLKTFSHLIEAYDNIRFEKSGDENRKLEELFGKELAASIARAIEPTDSPSPAH